MKKLLFIFVLYFCSFATIYTDNFSASNSNWTTTIGESALSISGGVLNYTAEGRNGSYYSASDLKTDMYVQSKIIYTTGVGHMYVTARHKADAETYYFFGFSGDALSWRIASMIDGSSTTLISGTFGTPAVSGSTIGLSTNGTTLVGYVNGTQVGTYTDNTITGTGYAGMFMSTSAGDWGTYDDFYMNDVNLLPPSLPNINHIVTPGNSLHDTINNAAIGDTITISGGPAVYTLPKLATNMKKRVYLRTLTADTIEKGLGEYNVITLNADSCTVINCNFRWRDSAATTVEYVGMIGGNNTGGHLLYSNSFKRPSSVPYVNAKGICLRRTNATTVLPPTIFRKNYCDTVNISFGDSYASMPNNITMDSNTFVNSMAAIGDKGIFRWNYCYKGAPFDFFGDSLLIEWNYGGSFFTGSPEYFGNDDNVNFSRGSVVRHNYIDSIEHNLMWDGVINFKFHNNVVRKSNTSYYNHGDEAIDVSSGVEIFNNWLSGTSTGQYISFSAIGGYPSSDIRISRNIFFGDVGTTLQNDVSVVRDTIDSCFSKLSFGTTNFAIATGNTFGTTISVIDTNIYPFLIQNRFNPMVFGNGKTVGPYKFLTYLYGKDSTASSITTTCSLSTQFRYGGNTYSIGRKNAWLLGDTAQIVIQHTTDTSGSLTTVIADSLVAGQNATITISALPAATKQFYRTISNGISSQAGEVHDTTAWNSITTLSADDEESFDSTIITSDVGNTKECPTVIIQPESDTTGVDSLLSFIVQAVGSSLTYQWKLSGVNVGTNANYYQKIAVKADSGKFVKCVITGDTCSAETTDSVLVSVNGISNPNPPVITLQPRDTTVNSGSVAPFMLVASNSTGYQWYRNDLLIPDATNSVYSFSTTYNLNGSRIWCIVYNLVDTISSDTVTLTIVQSTTTGGTSRWSPYKSNSKWEAFKRAYK